MTTWLAIWFYGSQVNVIAHHSDKDRAVNALIDHMENCLDDETVLLQSAAGEDLSEQVRNHGYADHDDCRWQLLELPRAEAAQEDATRLNNGLAPEDTGSSSEPDWNRKYPFKCDREGCIGTGEHVEWSMQDCVNSGTPICPACGDDMCPA